MQGLLTWGEGTCLNKFSLPAAGTSCPIYYPCAFPAGWRAVCLAVEFLLSGSSVNIHSHTWQAPSAFTDSFLASFSLHSQSKFFKQFDQVTEHCSTLPKRFLSQEEGQKRTKLPLDIITLFLWVSDIHTHTKGNAKWNDGFLWWWKPITLWATMKNSFSPEEP